MIILSPVEQSIDNASVYSSQYFQIDTSYINVAIKTTGVSNFKLDGVTRVPNLKLFLQIILTLSPSLKLPMVYINLQPIPGLMQLHTDMVMQKVMVTMQVRMLKIFTSSWE